jgi:hypothetical protein
MVIKTKKEDRQIGTAHTWVRAEISPVDDSESESEYLLGQDRGDIENDLR